MQPAATPANDADAIVDTRRYFNRELSWLAFNRRVLEEACNPAHPLLERLRFLSISGNNLDEFFMVRVAGLKAQQLLGVEEPSADGLTPAQQLAALATEADALTTAQQEVWADLREMLRGAGVAVLSHHEVDAADGAWLDQHFRDHIFPVLTPQAIDPAHPFPFIPNKGFSLIFDLKRISDGEPIRELLMVPSTLPRFVRIPGEAAHYVAIEHLIRRQIGVLFPGYELRGGGAFRIIRDSDIEIEEEQMREMLEHRLDRDIARGIARQADEALDRGGQQDKLAHRLTVRLADQIEDHARSLVGDERERVRGIERLRRQDREDLLAEMGFEPGLGLALDRIGVEDMDAGLGEVGTDIGPHALLIVGQRLGLGRDGGELLAGREPVGGARLDLLELLAHQAGDADHEELVEVRARDRQEAQPLEQRMGGVARLFHHPPVEGEPAQLAIEVTCGIIRRFGHQGPFNGACSRCLGHRR